jgi:hypothetical protein
LTLGPFIENFLIKLVKNIGHFRIKVIFIVAGDINSPGNHYWQQHKQRNDVKRRPSCVSMAKFPIMITLLTLLILHTKIQNKV